MVAPRGEGQGWGRGELIAQVDLFAGLDRVVLAKLAASFDPVLLVEGEPACEQGDPGDSLYLVSAGALGVFASTGEGQGTRVRTLGPGDYFGEMALLTQETRSATVRADVSCELLKLDKKRFDELVRKEPSVALAMAATLSRRLRGMTEGVAERERVIGGALTERLAQLSSDARLRLYAATLLQEPGVEELRAVYGSEVEAVAADMAALGALGGPAASLVRDSLRDRLNRELGRQRAADAADAAAAALERSGLNSQALALVGRSGDRKALAAALGRALQAVPSVPESELQRWLDRIGDEEARTDPLVAQARARLLEGRGEHTRARMLSSSATTRTSLVELVRRPASRSRSRILAGSLAGVLVLAGVLQHSSPRDTFLLLLVAAVVMWTTEAVPEFAVSLGLLAGWMVLGVATPAQALSGFGSNQWMFALAILSIAGSISHSGLLFRLGLFLARRMPKGLFGQSATLLLTGVVMTPLLPSSTARAALTTPIAVSVVDAARHEERSPAAAVLGQAAWIGANPLLFVFLNGSTSTLLAWGLLPSASQERFGWFTWFLAAAPLGALVAAGSLAALFLVLRPGPSPELSQARLRLQVAILGPPKPSEWMLSAILLLTVVGWVVASKYDQDHGAVTLLAAVAAVVTASLDRKALAELDWAFLMSFGVMLAMTQLTVSLGLDKWAAAHVGVLVGAISGGKVVVILSLACLNLLGRLLLPPNQCLLILGLALLPLSGTLGLDPWLIMMVLLATSQTWFFPSQNLAYMVAHASSEGKLFTHQQARRVSFAYTAVTLLALVLCVPYWRMLHLL